MQAKIMAIYMQDKGKRPLMNRTREKLPASELPRKSLVWRQIGLARQQQQVLQD